MKAPVRYKPQSPPDGISEARKSKKALGWFVFWRSFTGLWKEQDQLGRFYFALGAVGWLCTAIGAPWLLVWASGRAQFWGLVPVVLAFCWGSRLLDEFYSLIEWQNAQLDTTSDLLEDKNMREEDYNRLLKGIRFDVHRNIEEVCEIQKQAVAGHTEDQLKVLVPAILQQIQGISNGIRERIDSLIPPVTVSEVLTRKDIDYDALHASCDACWGLWQTGATAKSEYAFKSGKLKRILLVHPDCLNVVSVLSDQHDFSIEGVQAQIIETTKSAKAHNVEVKWYSGERFRHNYKFFDPNTEKAWMLRETIVPHKGTAERPNEKIGKGPIYDADFGEYMRVWDAAVIAPDSYNPNVPMPTVTLGKPPSSG